MRTPITRRRLAVLAACITLLFPTLAALLVLPAGSAQAAAVHNACSGVCLPPVPCTVGCAQPTTTATPSQSADPSASSTPTSSSSGSCGPQPGTPACLPGGNPVTGAFDSVVLDPLTSEVSAAVTSVLEWTLTYWLDISPIQSVQGTGGLLILPIANFVGLLIAVLLLIGQGVKTILSRKGAPLLQAFEGLGKLALYTSAGTLLIDSLLAASNALTKGIFTYGFKGASTTAAAQQMVSALLPSGIGDVLLLNIAVLTFAVGLVQAGMLYVRTAALPIQTLMLPIGAAGQIGSGATAQWMPKILASIFAVILYKPLAMAILAVGFDEMTGATGLGGVILGLLTLVLSVLAMPTLMRIFAPLTGAMGGGGGGGLLGVAGEAMMMRSMGGRGGAPTGPGGAPAAAGAQASTMAGSGPAASVVGSGAAAGGGAVKAAGLKGATAAVGGPAAAALLVIKAADAAVKNAASTMAGPGGHA